ncbi:MAG: phage P2 GpE-like tail protein [Osedax symbiont Rs2]|nr:MAG: phage P2 GpE-like tail protein [Osedax symbiont Rs2]
MKAKKPETEQTVTFSDNKDRQTVILHEQIKRGNTCIDEIQVRTPRAGELRGLSLADLLNVQVDALKELLPRITAPAITGVEIDNLHPADLVQLSTKVIAFLAPPEKPDSLIA